MPLENSKLVAELFDIAGDPFEKRNVAAERPDVVALLWKKLKDQGPGVGDARPYFARAPEDWVAPPDWSHVPE